MLCSLYITQLQESEAITLQFLSLSYRSLAEAVKYGLENEDIVSLVNLFDMLSCHALLP